jgi:N-acetylglucosamine-6-phosphate deacetylase
MRQTITNCRLLRDGALHEGHAVIIDGDMIADVLPAASLSPGMPRHDLAGAILAPGLIDIQINGGGGVLFNETPTVDGIRAIGTAHARTGTTGFLPTIISADHAAIARAMDAVDAAISAGVPGVLGIHVEGPFLNPARKGIHDEGQFRHLDAKALSLLTKPRRGCVLLTLAPEIVPAATTKALADAGVLVCAGHSDADYATVRAGLDAGIRGFTHLFNAMSQFTGRQPGMVGAALEDKDSWCGLIADGHHIHPASLRVALAAKGLEKLILVTDAMPSVGAATKSFRLQGRDITVTDGVCRAADGTLAGSDLDMISAVRNSMTMMAVSLPQAIQMASLNPAAFLRLSGRTGVIAPGLRADFIVLDDQYRLIETWIGGQPRLQHAG